MVGSICSVIVVFIVAKAIGLDTAVMNSMLPQAATTAIALPISESIGGIPQLHRLQLFSTQLSYTH